MMRAVSVVLVVALLPLAGCISPTQSVAAVPSLVVEGDVVRPAPALELAHVPPVYQDLREGASLGLGNVMLGNLSEDGWESLQFLVRATEWRKPFDLDGKELTVTIDGQRHVTLDGHQVHPVPEDWRNEPAPSAPGQPPSVYAMGDADQFVVWRPEVPIPFGASLAIDLWSIHYETTTPERTDVPAGWTHFIIGGHSMPRPFTTQWTDLWYFDRIEATAQDETVDSLEIRIIASMEQDLSDSPLGIATEVERSAPADALSWFPLHEVPVSIIDRTDDDDSIARGWADAGDALTLRLDLGAAGITLEPGTGSFVIDIGMEMEPRMHRHVPMHSDWDAPHRTLLYQAPPPPEGDDAGSCGEECGGSSG